VVGRRDSMTSRSPLSGPSFDSNPPRQCQRRLRTMLGGSGSAPCATNLRSASLDLTSQALGIANSPRSLKVEVRSDSHRRIDSKGLDARLIDCAPIDVDRGIAYALHNELQLVACWILRSTQVGKYRPPFGCLRGRRPWKIYESVGLITVNPSNSATSQRILSDATK
jgi:hypothetical protein